MADSKRYFSSPSGRAIDVQIDKLEVSHGLTFADRIDRMPHTLDSCDLLLSKLQIFELNEHYLGGDPT